MSEQIIWIECDCGTHALRVEKYTETDTYEGREVELFDDYYFAIFNYGSQRRGVWHRIKVAAWVLWTGKFHRDQISLRTEEIKRLRDFLNTTIKHENS